MASEDTRIWWRAFGGIALFVLLGFPLAGYLWHTLNLMLSLEASTRQVLTAVPVLLLFVAILYALARAIRRWLPDEVG
ncbi:MAG: hypothetical protein ACOCSK_00075 [Rhodothermales bacterium]